MKTFKYGQLKMVKKILSFKMKVVTLELRCEKLVCLDLETVVSESQ